MGKSPIILIIQREVEWYTLQLMNEKWKFKDIILSYKNNKNQKI